MAAAGHQPDARVAHPFAVSEAAGVEMRRDVVVAHDGNAERGRDRLAGGQAHQQRTDQPGPDGDGHGGEVGTADAGPRQRLVDHRNDPFDVGTGGHFRHDAPPPCVDQFLTGHDTRQHGAITRDDRGSCFVARGFDGKQGHGTVESTRSARC